MATKFKNLQARPAYVSETYNMLLAAIIDGSLAPGERITQEEIAEQLSVSRSPVLQAILLLKKDGLMQDAPGRGVLVAPLDLTKISQLYEVRGSLDGLAAKLAAERRFKIDPEILINGRKTAERHDVNAMIEADMAFHNAIYQASNNPLIAETAFMHWVHLRRAMGAVLEGNSVREAIWDEHIAIAKAIEKGQCKKAVELTELHITNARASLVERLGVILDSTPSVKS